MKLTDTQLVIANKAAQHKDRLFVKPEQMDGRAFASALGGLVKKGLAESGTPALGAFPEAYRNADGKTFCITADGEKALGIGDEPAAKVKVKREPKAKADKEPAAPRDYSGKMKRTYHDAYMSNGGGNGDNIDAAMKKAFLTLEVEGKKELALDRKAIQKWAEAIECWNPRYLDLNNGMVRMNVANRVRAKVKAGEVVKLDGKVLRS